MHCASFKRQAPPVRLMSVVNNELVGFQVLYLYDQDVLTYLFVTVNGGICIAHPKLHNLMYFTHIFLSDTNVCRS